MAAAVWKDLPQGRAPGGAGAVPRLRALAVEGIE